MEGTTKSGYKYSIDERVKTDWEFLKAIAVLQKNPSDIETLEKVLILTLTEKGFDKLKKHIAKNNGGYVPVEVISAEFLEIVQSNEEIKK